MGSSWPGGSGWACGACGTSWASGACRSECSDGSGWARRSGRPSSSRWSGLASGTRRPCGADLALLAPGHYALVRFALRRIADDAQELLLASRDRVLVSRCHRARCQGCRPARQSERYQSHCNRAYVHASSLRRCRTGGSRGRGAAPDVPIGQECGKHAWLCGAVEISSLTRYGEAREVDDQPEFVRHASRAAQPRARPRRP